MAVGDRWDELKAIAQRRRYDATLTFGALHYLLALAATGDLEAAWSLVRAMGIRTDFGSGDQSEVMGAVGIELATVILDLVLDRAPRGDSAELVTQLHRIGGSHAQRGVCRSSRRSAVAASATGHVRA